ncbi:unnamed protein product [Fusarium venenatum]|uniref:Uncharacterized protein n=1 Tax=Fusarium venenatum TaxID=56646 RepID=A0A2L2T5B7_9HYPO|nr:uncharacterized protein FVRRES_07349 [Fusarium venenatum]CEI62913.1 unnamed protein product [Fusarium venenatum]
MQRTSNDRSGPQTQLVLGTTSPSSSLSLFNSRYSKSFVWPADKPTPVLALIKDRLSIRKQRALRKMGLHKGSDLRTVFQAREATSEDQGNTSWELCYCGTQTEPPESDEILRGQPKIDSTRGTPDSFRDGMRPVPGVRDERVQQLCENPYLCREEREELEKAIMNLKLRIEQAKIAANMYFRQAHGWEDRSPIPNDLDSLPQMLQGLYTVMIWMQQRIQVYESIYPKLRPDYDAGKGLID